MELFQTLNKKKIAALTAGIAGAGLFFYHQNNSLVTTEIAIASTRIPKNFNGFKIAHLSDLHQKRYGRNQRVLVEEVKKQSPDIIAVTGDLVDAKTAGFEPGITLIRELANIAPVYYVTGNHEGKMNGYYVWREKVKETDVHLLELQTVPIRQGNEEIFLLGVDDPEVTEGRVEGAELRGAAERSIKTLLEGTDSDSFKILLSHRPELFSLYSGLGLDLTLSGHAHGGQIRLPLIGGVFAPGQGLFPTYTAGEYAEGDSHMVVSRGLGPTIFPTRLFNRPEVIIITLQKQFTVQEKESNQII